MADNCEWDLCPWIEPLVSHVVTGDLHLCAGKASVRDFISSAHPSRSNTEENDTFTVIIPYAGVSLQWQVLFCGADSCGMPDFLIPEHDGFDPEYKDIPNLVNWDVKNPKSLLNVVKDILSLYKDHQMKLVSKENSKFAKDVQELVESKEYERVDVYLAKVEAERHSAPRTSINILVQIELDPSEIPDICFKDAPPEDPSFQHPVLQIHCNDPGKITPQLYMPKRMEHVLGGRNSMKLPSYSRQTTVLLEYVQTVHRNLYDVIAILRDGHSKRREYVAAFLRQYSNNVVEYDAEDFRKISLLFSYEDFYFLVHIALGQLFPQEQPDLTFQSVYHTTKSGSLYQVVHSNYPYSPRWSGIEMAKRTRAYVLERIEAFKAGCMKHGVV